MFSSEIMEEIRTERKSIAIVTGASGSMGSCACKMLSRRGFRVIMACRNTIKGEEKRREITSTAPSSELEVMELDLSSFQSIRNFAAELKQRGERIDALFNNAGVISRNFCLTEDGWEQSMGVNFAGAVLLTELLLPLMNDGARIVNMVSLMCNVASFKHDKLFSPAPPKKFNKLARYASSKLALLFYSIGLSERLQGRIKVNVADPGVVDSNMLRMGKWFDPLTDALFRPFCKSPSKGVFPAVEALCSEENLKLFRGRSHRSIPKRFLSRKEDTAFVMQEALSVTHNL